MKTRLALFCIPMILIAGLALAAPSEDLWLHVYVEEDGEHGETVRVNIPMSLIEAVLPMIDNEHLRDGKVQILDELHAEGLDVRGIWEALRDTPDGEFVRVEGQDESVKVAKENGFLRIRVEEDDEKVRVQIPLDVVDALFSGGEDELDVGAMIRALHQYKGQDMVVVEEGSTRVRVWIDDRQEGQP